MGVHAAWLTTPALLVVVQVGSMMIKSPGWAPSIALWMLAEAATCVGAWPPIVTVTVSIDCLAFDGWPAVAVLAVVITSSPHCASEPPYWSCCWMGQSGTLLGTLTTMRESLQLLRCAVLPPMVTDPFPCEAPKP